MPSAAPPASQGDPTSLDPRCLDYCLTEEESRQFDTQGHLMIDGALDAGDLVAAGAESSRQRAYRAWHQDSMRVNDEIEIHPRPRLSVKVAYFLTDTTVPDCGNMWVYPGSQRMDDLHVPEGEVDPPGAVPVVGKPGTAIIFDRRLWHSRSLNTSSLVRKGVFFGYSYRWLQPKDDMNVRQLYPTLDPIRRQILGDALCADGRYAPLDGDVPLRGWLEQQERLETAGLGLGRQAGSAPPPR